MQRITLQANHMLVLLIAGMLASAPALAKPSWVGGEKAGKQEQNDREGGDQKPDRGQQASPVMEQRGTGVHRYIGDEQRAAAHEYYAQRLQAGRCPPGLAKKRNGCMPPGQAKKWKMGQPLPHDLAFHNLPPQLADRLGPPPAGHRYVRVAADILLIAIGTAMVVDAIEDMGKM